MRKLAIGLLSVGSGLWSLGCCAENLRQQMVASTLVTGTVQVSPDGNVHDFKVGRVDKLPGAARDLLNRSLGNQVHSPPVSKSVHVRYE